MNGKIGLRIVTALVLIAAVAGIAYFAFQAGFAQGSPITIQAPSGQTAPLPYPYYGYGMPFHRPFGFGFGFGCFGPLLAFFLIFLLVRFIFWGGRWGWGQRGMYGPWRHGWGEGGVPPMFEEWHKRAHGQSSDTGTSETSEKTS
ncbi:MAG TPA: hypothetical protein VK249_25140 [Anaerolineales bacterium]|nr:hypothetical protein [Anaerolineales bacterium]